MPTPAMTLLMANLFSDERVVPLAVIVVATFLLMSTVRRRQRKPPPPRAPAPRPQPVVVAQEERLRRDIESLLVELQELSRTIGAQIDTRFSKLEAAIRDADRRIATLNRLTQLHRGKAGDRSEDVCDPDARHAIVYELADAGLTSVEIAKDLGKTPGEVELILNLRQKPRPTAPPET